LFRYKLTNAFQVGSITVVVNTVSTNVSTGVELLIHPIDALFVVTKLPVGVPPVVVNCTVAYVDILSLTASLRYSVINL
jgi:hypothetical protein